MGLPALASVTLNRAVIVCFRLVITRGVNWIDEITRRFGSEIAVIEIAPPTPTGVGVGVGVGDVPVVMRAVVSEVPVVDPTRFFAVTWTRIVLSLSPERTPYVLPVAPVMSLQPAPFLSQSCHWYVNVDGPSAQRPGSAVSVSPTCGLPEIDGFVV